MVEALRFVIDIYVSIETDESRMDPKFLGWAFERMVIVTEIMEENRLWTKVKSPLLNILILLI